LLRPPKKEKKAMPTTNMSLSSPDLHLELDLSSVTGESYHPELMTPMVMNSNVPAGSGHNPFKKQSSSPAQLQSTPLEKPRTDSVQESTSTTTNKETVPINSNHSSRTNSVPSNNGTTLPPIEKKTWRYTLFGFKTDWQFCLSAVFCPCIAIGKNFALRHGRESKNKTFDNQSCWISGLCCCIVPCYTLQEHKKNKLILGIPVEDNTEPSCFCLFCCFPCTLTLDHQELMDWKFQSVAKPLPRDQTMSDGMEYSAEIRTIPLQSKKKTDSIGSSNEPTPAVHWHSSQKVGF